MNDQILIASLRKTKGWTQEVLAEKSGISLRTIQRLESGQETSLDTLRLVAEALEVSISDLFKKDEDNTNKDEIERYSREVAVQMNRRKSDNELFKIGRVFFFIFIIFLSFVISLMPKSIQGVAGITWVGILLTSFSIIKYIRLSWWELKLDKKYPLTRGVEKTRQSSKELMWWKDKVTRRIMLIIYSGIIPLLFILKYVLHLF